MDELLKRKWAYKNTSLLLVSILVFLLIADTPIVHKIIAHIGNFGYLGSILAGISLVSTFTFIPSVLVIFHLAQEYNIFLIAVTAGFGSMLGDLFLFRFFKDRVFEELSPLLKQVTSKPVLTLFKSPYFIWLTPLIGAIIIASPIPDEIGIGMMGLSKLKEWQFMFLTYILNTVGILVIVLLAQS